ncbi:LD-carboxypeptidase LdcB/DacB [Streptococcus cameli]
MKKNSIAYSVLLLLVFVLVACGKTTTEKTKKTTTTTKSSSVQVKKTEESTRQPVSSESSDSQEIPPSTTETSSSQSSITASKAQYNGSYYSVQGKYGEVIIVNKKHPLSSSYAPGEDPTALAAFWQLLGDMKAAGYAVSNQYSGFRSYEYQSSLYNSYLASDSKENVDSYSARPGHSEHQTGLAFDVLDASGALLTEPNASYWLAQNAHRYGFIVRYIEGKEHITGFMKETWHIRYIGQEATDIFNSGLSLEEYFGVPGGDYVD